MLTNVIFTWIILQPITFNNRVPIGIISTKMSSKVNKRFITVYGPNDLAYNNINTVSPWNG